MSMMLTVGSILKAHGIAIDAVNSFKINCTYNTHNSKMHNENNNIQFEHISHMEKITMLSRMEVEGGRGWKLNKL